MAMGKVSVGKVTPPIMQAYVEIEDSKSPIKGHLTGVLQGIYKGTHVIMTRVVRSENPINISEYYNSKRTPSNKPVVINLLYLKCLRPL